MIDTYFFKEFFDGIYFSKTTIIRSRKTKKNTTFSSS